MSELAAPGQAAVEAATSNEKIGQLEQLLLMLPQVDLRTRNLLHGGMCARSIVVPKGGALTGAQSNHPNICIAVGDITVTTDKGPVRFTGVHVIPANAGRKRAGFAHEDTIWVTVWRTDAETVAEAEDDMTDESERLQSRRLLGANVTPTLVEQGEAP